MSGNGLSVPSFREFPNFKDSIFKSLLCSLDYSRIEIDAVRCLTSIMESSAPMVSRDEVNRTT